MNFTGLLLILAGLFSVAGASFDWEWFMNHRKARLFTKLLGRTGARIFYGLLGFVIAVLGVFTMFGIIS